MMRDSLPALQAQMVLESTASALSYPLSARDDRGQP